MENFWQACSHKLEQELTPQQYSAWIKPLVPLDFEDGLLARSNAGVVLVIERLHRAITP